MLALPEGKGYRVSFPVCSPAPETGWVRCKNKEKQPPRPSLEGAWWSQKRDGDLPDSKAEGRWQAHISSAGLWYLCVDMCVCVYVCVCVQGIKCGRRSAWRTMDAGAWHCTGSSDQNRPKEKEMKEGKAVVCEGFTNSWGKRRSEKKDLNDLDNHECMITHLKPDILECRVTWALGSIAMNKAGGGDRITAELFQILNDDAVKVLHSTCQQIQKIQQLPLGFFGNSAVKNLPAIWEVWARSLGGKDPLEKEMATHPSTLAWEILGTESLVLQSTGLQESNHHHHRRGGHRTGECRFSFQSQRRATAKSV